MGPASDDPVKDEKNIKAHIARENTKKDRRVCTLWIMPGATHDSTVVQFLQPSHVLDVEEEWDTAACTFEQEYTWNSFSRVPRIARQMRHGDVRLLPNGKLERLTTYHLSDRKLKAWNKFTAYYTPFGKIVRKNNAYHVFYTDPREEGEQTLPDTSYYLCNAQGLLVEKRDDLARCGVIPTWSRCEHEM